MRGKNMEIITSPWLGKFRELISQTRKEFIFTSPFIKTSAVTTLLNHRINDFSINGIISFRLRNFERGASDIEAVRLLRDSGAFIKNVSNIHSKTYIFDSSLAVVSSANLTPAGLSGNVEIGVLLRGNAIIKRLKKHVLNMIHDSDMSCEITEAILSESEKILESIPRPIPDKSMDLQKLEKRLFGREDSIEDKVFQGGGSAILSALTGWKKEVFQALLRIEKDSFRLADVYGSKELFSGLHPVNRNVKAKVRQQLQELRDMGLLEFTDYRGTYRKLWRQG